MVKKQMKNNIAWVMKITEMNYRDGGWGGGSSEHSVHKSNIDVRIKLSSGDLFKSNCLKEKNFKGAINLLCSVTLCKAFKRKCYDHNRCLTPPPLDWCLKGGGHACQGSNIAAILRNPTPPVPSSQWWGKLSPKSVPAPPPSCVEEPRNASAHSARRPGVHRASFMFKPFISWTTVQSRYCAMALVALSHFFFFFFLHWPRSVFTAKKIISLER